MPDIHREDTQTSSYIYHAWVILPSLPGIDSVASSSAPTTAPKFLSTATKTPPNVCLRSSSPAFSTVILAASAANLHPSLASDSHNKHTRRNRKLHSEKPQESPRNSSQITHETKFLKVVTGKRVNTPSFNPNCFLLFSLHLSFATSALLLSVLLSSMPQQAAQEILFMHRLTLSDNVSFFLRQCTSVLQHLLSGDGPQTFLP